jgi:pyruvate/2-oxoglutarate/acetoin dehydrogenase E1 component
MAATVRDTIKEITRKHLTEGKGKCYGQCLTAVGWVGGTLPELYEESGMIELSMADVAGGAIVTGAALAGDRSIYVVRYQGFQWYNAASIVNYAAKSKEIWGRICPVFVRSIAMEGAVGPVAGSSHHSLVHRMPGIKVIAPMTPDEYKHALLALIFEYANKFIIGNIAEYPSEWKEEANEALEQNDTFKEWFLENFEFGSGDSYIISDYNLKKLLKAKTKMIIRSH